MSDGLKRREFFRMAFGACASALIGVEAAGQQRIPIYRGREASLKDITDLKRAENLHLHEARYWRGVGGQVQCTLCPKFCLLAEGETGACRMRVNRERKLYTKVYGQPCAVSYHPVEQAPIFHVVPGMRCLALATAGCNLRCLYCQNWQFSQVGPEKTTNYDLSPAQAVELAKRSNCKGINYTFTEPVIFFEYTLDTAIIAKKNGLKNLMVTAGYIDPVPLRELCPLFDCIRIDLKGFTEQFYQTVVQGRLKPVLKAIETVKQEGVFLEIVNLVLPGMNDSPQGIEQMCKWIVKNVGADVPVHFLRFYPAYRLRNLPSTPIQTLERCRQIGVRAGLHFVYIGNVPGHDFEDTYCPNCKRAIIRRVGFVGIEENRIVNGGCGYCKHPIPGVWS